MTQDGFLARLATVEPAKGRHEPSEVRTRIEAAFAEITAARARGVTWPQVAALMAEEGLEVTADQVRALYHAVKYANDPESRRGKRKRGKRGGRATAAAPSRAMAPPSLTETKEPAPATAAPQETNAQGGGWKAMLRDPDRERAEREAAERPRVQHRPGQRG